MNAPFQLCGTMISEKAPSRSKASTTWNVSALAAGRANRASSNAAAGARRGHAGGSPRGRAPQSGANPPSAAIPGPPLWAATQTPPVKNHCLAGLGGGRNGRMTHTVLATGLGFPEGPVWLGPRRVAFTQIRGQCISLWDGSRVTMVARTGGGANGATLGPDGA